MKFTHRILLTTSLLLGGLIPTTCHAHEVTLTLDKITQIKGSVLIAIYNSADSYNSNTNLFSGKKIPVTAKVLTINLGDLPTGDYAIKLYQDENDNGSIDKNFMGIPKEGYGFSNNGGAMSQPDFDEARFNVNADKHINIHLR